jgi:hypothetical protein
VRRPRGGGAGFSAVKRRFPKDLKSNRRIRDLQIIIFSISIKKHFAIETHFCPNVSGNEANKNG